MKFEGDRDVLRNLFRKRDYLAIGDGRHAQYRTLILVLSGALRGVYGGGQVIALEEAGLRQVFDVAVGISTGAPTLAYFLAGQSRMGATIYHDECTSTHFISRARLLRGVVTREYAVDVDYLERVFTGAVSSKKLEIETLMRARTKYYIGATDGETGQARLFHPDSASSIVDAMKASLALPGLGHGNVQIEGRRYLDGALALPFPAEKVIKRFRPTDLLVLANRSAEYTERSVGFLSDMIFLRKYPDAVRKTLKDREAVFARELSFLRGQQESRVAILWGDQSVRTFESNKKKLVHAKEKAIRHLKELLHHAEAGGSIS